VKKSISLLLFSMMAGMGWAQGPTRPAITGIAFMRIYAADPEVSAQFYDHDLGFTREKLKGYDRYAVSDSQWVEVVPLPVPAPPSRTEAIAFTTRDAAGLARYLEAHQVAIVQKLKNGQFGVKDPEGNLVIFVQAGSVKIPPQFLTPRRSSQRMIHVGFVVQSRDAEDKFYREILGFRPNWYGGRSEDRPDWVSIQVPDGTDWVEYMLNIPATASLKQIGVQDHFSLGVAQMKTAIDQLAQNGCKSTDCGKSQMGRDGKVQMNLYDPDLTRVEFMEFKPSGTICCSQFLGKMPNEVEDK
jgi:catechol 2,3-dioxygenase-like lactoylglutathione lyase family enzyme